MQRCNGRRPHPYPSYRTDPCNTAARARVTHRFCDQLYGRLNTPAARAQCVGLVCQRCVDASRNALIDEENYVDQNLRLRALCTTCQSYEARRHPNGFSNCHCIKNLSRRPRYGWKCHICRREALDILKQAYNNTQEWLLEIGRDRQGRFVWHPTRFFFRDKDPCPGCGRPIPLGNIDDGVEETVSYCTSCGGIDVKATEGQGWRATRISQRAPLRYSARLRALNAAKPPLTFIPIDIFH